MNTAYLLSYIILGFTLAAPIGPVNSARLDRGIRYGFWHAWVVGAGSMTVDGIFMAIVYLGLIHFLDIPIVQIFLWLFGGFILIYTGMEGIKSGNAFSISDTRKEESLIKSFFTGFILSISSPLSILFWLGIYGSFLAKTAAENGPGYLLLYSSMIFLGLTLWDIIVATITAGFRKYLNFKHLKWISFLSSLSLIGFGIYFGFEGVKALWIR